MTDRLQQQLHFRNPQQHIYKRILNTVKKIEYINVASYLKDQVETE